MLFKNKKSSRVVYWLIALMCFVIALYVDDTNKNLLEEKNRRAVLTDLSLLRARLEGVLSEDLQLVRGMVPLIVQDPDLDQSQFSRYAQLFLDHSPRIKNLGGAPDMVLSMIYPIQGNEGALGLNYLTHPTQRAQAVEARDSGKLTLAGPITLLQGGQGLIGRIPVFLKRDKTGKTPFWGLLSVVLDADRLFQEINLESFTKRYRIAMRHRKGRQVFWGDPAVFDLAQVSAVVLLPGSEWEIAAVPKETAMKVFDSELWLPRFLLLSLLLVSLGFVYLARRWSIQQQATAYKLEASRDRFSSLVSNIPGVTYRFSSEPGFRVLFVSQQIKALTGYGYDDYVVRCKPCCFYELILQEHQGAVMQAITTASKENRSWEVEYQIKAASNDVLWIQDKGKGVYDETGNLIYLEGFLLDVTAQKGSQLIAEQAARHNRVLAELSVHDHVVEGRFEQAQELLARRIVEAIDVERASIWVMDEAQSEIVCAVLYERSTGTCSSGVRLGREDYPKYLQAIIDSGAVISNDALTEEQMSEFVDSYLKPLGIGALADTAIFDGSRVCGVVCAEHIGGKREWNRMEVSFMVAAATFAGSLFAQRKQKETELYLREAKRLAEEATQSKSSFLATMSHEIRTPMNGVLGMLSVLEPMIQDQKQLEYLSVCRSSAESLLSIINDILDFSKIEAGHLHLECIPLDIENLAVECVRSAQLSAEQKGLQIYVDVSELSGVRVMGDPVRLSQIMTNLVSNAIKFTEKGCVVVKLKPGGTANSPRVLLCVSDTGVGIPREKLSMLFEAFKQLDSSTTREYGGTGLGLAIVKTLCELMNGEINATSSVGEGSEFVVSLPCEASSEVAPALSAEATCLLFVADVKRREILTAQLTLAGANVVLWPLPSELDSDELLAIDRVIFDVDAMGDLSDFTAWREKLNRHLKTDRARFFCLESLVSFNHKLLESLGVNSMARVMTQAQLICLLEGDDAQRLAPAKPTAAVPSHGPAEILVVEDNEVNQMVMRSLLAQLGYACDIVTHGREALDRLASVTEDNAYRMILMDCQMPEMDGYDATRAIRSQKLSGCCSDIPIVAFTANAMSGDESLCREAGMDDYLSKPVNVEVLKACLEKWLPR